MCHFSLFSFDNHIYIYFITIIFVFLDCINSFFDNFPNQFDNLGALQHFQLSIVVRAWEKQHRLEEQRHNLRNCCI